MPVVAYLAIVCVVWVVITLPEGRMRGFVYALPIPMSIAIVASPAAESGTQLLGVPLLVGFFFVVAVLERCCGRLVAVLSALGALVAVGAVLNSYVVLDWPTAYVLAVVLWLAGVALARLLPHPGETAAEATASTSQAASNHANVEESARRLRSLAALIERLPALGSALVATGVSFLFGSWLGPFVVTFPYSGAPVAFLLRGSVDRFATEFAMRSILLGLPRRLSRGDWRS